MAYHDRRRPRLLHDGDIISAETWNDLVQSNLDALAGVQTVRAEAQDAHAPGIVALAAMGAAASASQKPLSRRSLLFPWRRT